MAKAAATPAKQLGKSDLIKELIEATQLERKQVVSVLDTLTDIIKKQLKRAGGIKVLGLFNVKTKHVPERPAGEYPGFGGVMKQMPKRPASKKVKVLALKDLKEAVS